MEKVFHSVMLDLDKCVGCINCIRHCPTQAIRVRNGKAKILKELCIDCGECIRVCPTHAMRASYDNSAVINEFDYKVALLSPTVFGQIRNLDDLDYVMTAFKRIGFDDVFETSRAAELISEATRKYLHTDSCEYPLISSACPAVVRLIQLRFPDLCRNISPIMDPMRLAAKLAREEAVKKTGLEPEKIGVFYISPCTARVTEAKEHTEGDKYRIDGAIGICDIYHRLISEMEKIDKPEPLANSGLIGVSWASNGGEAAALMSSHYLAADGIENIIKVLEEIEDKKFRRLHFVELNACPAGCVGGVMTVKNPYMAKARTQILRKYLPVSMNHLESEVIPEYIFSKKPLLPVKGLKLSDSLSEALAMMNKIDAIEKKLPGLDCGACGAPTCQAFAEDAALGYADESDCVFVLKKQLEEIMESEKLFSDDTE